MFPKLEKNSFMNSVKKVAKVSLAGLMFAGVAAFANVSKSEVSSVEASNVKIEKAQENFVLKPSESDNVFAYHSSHSSHASHASHASHCSSYSECR